MKKNVKIDLKNPLSSLSPLLINGTQSPIITDSIPMEEAIVVKSLSVATSKLQHEPPAPLVLDLSNDGTCRRITNSQNHNLRKLLLSAITHNQPRSYSQDIFIDNITLHDTKFSWSSAAYKSLSIENAGGNSIYSEALSIDYFVRYFSAQKFVYEKEISYWADYKMIDYLCQLPMSSNVSSEANITVGVSVSRAMNHHDQNYSV